MSLRGCATIVPASALPRLPPPVSTAASLREEIQRPAPKAFKTEERRADSAIAARPS